jgi:CheY-like chemotaxis protein
MAGAVNILFVEDHFDTRVVIERVLSAAGHTVVAVGDYAGGMRAAQAVRCDVLLCDLQLPDGHGCNLLKEIRGMYPMRAIAVTAMGMPEDVELCRDAGFDAFVLKPVRLDELLLTIDSVMWGIVGIYPDQRASASRPKGSGGSAPTAAR